MKETLPMCFLTVAHLLLIKTMSEGGFFIEEHAHSPFRILH